VQLFTRNKKTGVQSFILNLLNNSRMKTESMIDGPRLERRVHLTIVVLVIPLEDKKPRVEKTFATVTKEFSSTGVGVVLSEPIGLDQVILGFRNQGEMTFIRAEARHLTPIGGGFFQLGLQMIEVVFPGKYPELRSAVL